MVIQKALFLAPWMWLGKLRSTFHNFYNWVLYLFKYLITFTWRSTIQLSASIMISIISRLSCSYDAGEQNYRAPKMIPQHSTNAFGDLLQVFGETESHLWVVAVLSSRVLNVVCDLFHVIIGAFHKRNGCRFHFAMKFCIYSVLYIQPSVAFM